MLSNEPRVIGKVDQRLNLDPVLTSSEENKIVEPEVFESVGELDVENDFGISDDELQNPESELNQSPLVFDEAREIVNSLKAPAEIANENVDDKYQRLVQEFKDFKLLIANDDAKRAKVDEIIEELDEYSIGGQLSKKEYKFVKDSVDQPSTKYNISFKTLDPRHVSYNRELESRVDKLEKLVGTQSLDPAEIMENRVFNESGNLSQVLETLNITYETLLKPEKFATVMESLKQSKKEFEELTLVKRKMKMEGLEATQDQQLNFLYTEMKKLLPIAQSLPKLVGRLHTLDEIHSDSRLYIEQVKLLVEEQKLLQNLASDIQIGLENIKSTVSSSQKIFDDNINVLKARIK